MYEGEIYQGEILGFAKRMNRVLITSGILVEIKSKRLVPPWLSHCLETISMATTTPQTVGTASFATMGQKIPGVKFAVR